MRLLVEASLPPQVIIAPINPILPDRTEDIYAGGVFERDGGMRHVGWNVNDFARAPRVLIVEDDEDIAQALQRSLRMEGYEVRAAGDGRAALEQGRVFAPDLVILDLGLPGIDGLEVARSLRADDDVPILILTARDALESRVEGLDAGADDYLVKPFERQELLARMRALLRRRPPRGSAPLRVASTINPARQQQVDASNYPLGAADWLAAHPEIGTRMFNQYGFGGYLAYRFYGDPNRRVFIFGEAALMGDDLLNEYADVYYVRSNWKQVLDKYRVDYVVENKGDPLPNLLATQPDWELVYQDKVSVIYVRTAPA